MTTLGLWVLCATWWEIIPLRTTPAAGFDIAATFAVVCLLAESLFASTILLVNLMANLTYLCKQNGGQKQPKSSTNAAQTAASFFIQIVMQI